MAIERVALVSWKPATPQEAIDTALRSVLALKNEVPGVLGITAGRNFSKWAMGFTHAFVVRFMGRQAVDAYDRHPAHRQLVATVFRPITEKMVVVDFDEEDYPNG